MFLSQCISSDVIMINVNHAGFTVCLFYGAVWQEWSWAHLQELLLAALEGGLGYFDDVCLDTRL